MPRINPAATPPARPAASTSARVAALALSALAGLFALTGLTGCGRPSPDGTDASNPAGASAAAHDSGVRAPDFPTNVTAYEARGLLKEVRAQGTKALIAHDDIPGYMEAMTMLLDVRPTNSLAGIRPGDTIAFRMLVTDTDGWIDRLRVLQPAATNSHAIAGTHSKTNPVATASAAATAAADPESEELAIGAPAPDCALTNQLGQPIRIRDFRGQALAFTFIFTRCPFPVYCPRLNSNFAEVQRQLTRAATNTVDAAGTNWHLLSISFDPEFDTPERLAKYAASQRHDPARWTFATGATEDVRRLGRGFSLAFWKEGALFNHNVRTVVIDPHGRIHKVFPDNEWKPAELVTALRGAMQASPPTPTP